MHIIEIGAKLAAFGPRFFKSGWNVMDEPNTVPAGSANQFRACSTTISRVPGSSNRCVAPGTISSCASMVI